MLLVFVLCFITSYLLVYLIQPDRRQLCMILMFIVYLNMIVFIMILMNIIFKDKPHTR